MKKYFVASLMALLVAVPAGAAITPPANEMPTNVEQCKKGGWQTYQVFKNQGDCVSYVVTEGKNQPNGL